MSELDLARSLARAEARLGGQKKHGGARRPRADRGRSRLSHHVEVKLASLLATQERPNLAGVARELGVWCRRRALNPPSRATIYNAIARTPAPLLDRRELPIAVEETLHNLGGPLVPGQQVVFAAFNYGDTQALSFAGSLPWLCLAGALRMRGFRPKSFALLRAIAACRGIVG